MTLRIRPLEAADVEAAEHVCRLAFGTFFGLPDPVSFRGDGALVRPRFLADPSGALVAETEDGIVGSGLITDWGGVGLFGPLTVHPDRWSSGIGRGLTAALLDLLDARDHDFVGLLTHQQSTRHVRLYEAFGFELQRPVAVLRREVSPAAMPDRARLMTHVREADACREVADTIWLGLDHTREIASVLRHGHGETVLLARADGAGLAGYALCHHGAGSEGNSSLLFVKAAAVRPGPDAEADLGDLLAACEALAASRGADTVAAGTNTGRREAYRILRERGYRSFMNAVAMLRPAGEGYGVPGVYAIDDWR